MDYLARAKGIFSGDVYATETTGIVIEDAGSDYARCSLEIRREHLNVSDTVMGGAIYTLADFTFAIAANSENPATVSLTGQITYLNPAACKKLTAEARCLKNGHMTSSYIVDVTDENGKTIASASFTGCKTNKNIKGE
ncbi:MAG: PaaI family thioesterase [Oscillospiraceae bacterium]|nr:PaaI family thioesterase [Oscillospiraceae bacterium]